MTHPDDKEFPRGRRKHRRVAAREVTAAVRAGAASFSYTVANLSAGGMLVTGDRPPPKGQNLAIELRRAGMAPIPLTGLYAHEDAAHRIGLAFAAPSPRAAAAVEKLIATIEAGAGAPPPLPALRPTSTGEELPVAAPPPLRPGEDPFAQEPDPRPPRAGSLDERNEYLRSLLKRRDEALQRGRTLHAAASAEATELRETVGNLEAKLVAALSQVRASEVALQTERRSAEEKDAAAKAERESAAEAMDMEVKHTVDALSAAAGLKAKVKALEAELAKTRADAEATLKAKTRQSDAELAKTRADAEATLAKTRADAEATLKAKTRQFEAELAASRREAEKAEHEVQALKADVAALRKALEAEAALKKERLARREANESLAEVRAAREAAEGELAKIGAEISSLKEKLETAESALEQYAGRRRADAPARRTAR